MTGFIELLGVHISHSELEITKARQLVDSLKRQDFVSFIECLRETGGVEVVVFDVDVELPQKRVHDIRHRERIAVRFDPADESLPETLALRSDFPKVPHLNLRQHEFPRSLCVFEEQYSELKLKWTTSLHIRSIRDWLALTARGELHSDDQPLEPLLHGSEGYLVYPQTIFDKESPVRILLIDQVVRSGSQKTYIARPAESLRAQDGQVQLLVTILCGKPQTHGLIHSRPRNLAELHDFLEAAGIDLLGYLRKQLLAWNEETEFDEVRDAGLVILILLPKTRKADDDAFDSVECRAFLTGSSIVEIGAGIGIWELFEGNLGRIVPISTQETGEGIEVKMLNPLPSFSGEYAATASGLNEATDFKFAAIGMGALGSQVVLNLARMGYGQWELIDHDILLPHNLARHGLTKNFIGYFKATGVAVQVNHMLGDNKIAQPLEESVLQSSGTARLAEAFEEAQIILDASASIAVARHLTHDIAATARRISVFLNPTATDLVILAENSTRQPRLDMLEMQYYRGLVQTPALNNHLQRGDERVRYGTSCRDLSSKIPQDLVALNAAICSRALRKIINDDKASVTVWSTDPDELTTEKHALSTGCVTEIEFDDWTVVTDRVFLEKVSQIRAAKLPNETGGVLIGSYDNARKIVYVIDTIPAPADSVEWPTVFIRGSQGLGREIERIQLISENQLEYVGEWHSHPRGVSCRPSSDDLVALSWLVELMANEGLPALMLIAADNDDYGFYLRPMEDT